VCNFIYIKTYSWFFFQVFPAKKTNDNNKEKKMVDNPMLAKLVAKVKTQATPPDNTPPPTPPVIRRNSTNQVPAPGPPSLPGPPPSTLSPPPSQPFLYSPPPPPLHVLHYHFHHLVVLPLKLRPLFCLRVVYKYRHHHRVNHLFSGKYTTNSIFAREEDVLCYYARI
jgi:hypothetical protein